MSSLLADYPYLATTAGVAALVGAVLPRFDPHTRRLAILSGTLGTPFAFASVFVVPAYWNPRRLAVFLGVGVEDLLFSFVTGALVWLCASFPWRRRLSYDLRIGRVLAGYLLSVLFGLSLLLLVRLLGLRSMASFVGSFACATAIMVAVRPRLVPLALTGAAAFAGVYSVLAWLSLAVAPGFLQQWSPEGIWGMPVLGLPLGEVVWAAGFGAAWPTTISFIAEVRLLSAHAETTLGPTG